MLSSLLFPHSTPSRPALIGPPDSATLYSTPPPRSADHALPRPLRRRPGTRPAHAAPDAPRLARAPLPLPRRDGADGARAARQLAGAVPHPPDPVPHRHPAGRDLPHRRLLALRLVAAVAPRVGPRRHLPPVRHHRSPRLLRRALHPPRGDGPPAAHHPGALPAVVAQHRRPAAHAAQAAPARRRHRGGADHRRGRGQPDARGQGGRLRRCRLHPQARQAHRQAAREARRGGPVKEYLRLLKEIVDRGEWKEQRAVLASTGKKPRAKALFGMQARFDLAEGFPLVTTKFVSFKGVAEELAWFLSGSTSNNDLLARGVKIWNEWADPETGDLGPIYGKQWRKWDIPGGGTWDQVAHLVANIRARIADPEASCGRRLILTAWNPPEMPRTKGPSACHSFVQFDVTRDRLSCQLYQRSADMFLGVPYNIASYALLTHLLAHVTGLRPGCFVHTFGDAHIYENHLEQVATQLAREPLPLPRLEVGAHVKEIDDYQSSKDVALSGYQYHPALRGEVAV
ncbi:MAG: thymidylate synthase [Gemmataceae bacterium]|nr:thymidylate synthase [Gemmataceae bacterium]